MNNRKRTIAGMILLLLFAINVCMAKPMVTEDSLAHGRIAAWPGSMAEKYVKERMPGARMVYLDTLADMAQNLRQNKIDAFAMNRLLADEAMESGQYGLEVLGGSMGKTSFAFAFAPGEKGEQLCREFNEFLGDCRENGKLAMLQEKWLNGSKEDRVPEEFQLSAENGTLSVVMNPLFPPLLYIQNNEIVGYEAELFRHFCAMQGYGCKISVASFETAMAGVATGQFDVGVSAIEYLEERDGKFLFSDRTCEADCVLVVRSDELSEAGLLATVKKRIEDTFLVEDRWKMFLRGMAITLVIAFSAAGIGTALGFLLCLLYQERNNRLNCLLDILSRLFQGMPVVVLLMIFYYIVFGKWDINGVLVAIVAFSLLFGLSVFDMLKNAATAISCGQMEGALALGFPERQAFLKFILPQAVRQAFPTYQGALVELLKATSIVGYIAVQDLTKMADIVRATIFDAFTPLVAITALYLVLVWLIQNITDRIRKKLDPKQRTKEDILRGITP